MPGHRFFVFTLALLLLFASGIMKVAGASNAQKHVPVEYVFPPQNTVVIDALAGIPTTTRFTKPGTFGWALEEKQSIGPEFRLIRATTITEIGAYVEGCYLSDPKSIEQCNPIPSINVKIYSQLNGKPDITKLQY